MSTPTAAERESAKSVLGLGGLDDRYVRDEHGALVDRIAQALADQRARYEAVAHEYEGFDSLAERIRQVAQ